MIGEHVAVGDRDPELLLAERHGLQNRERVEQPLLDQLVLGLQVLQVLVVEDLGHQEIADRGLGRGHVSFLGFRAWEAAAWASARRSTLPLLVRGSSRLNSTLSGTM